MICPKCKHDFIPNNRTSQQNKYLHAILGEIADQTGYSLNEVKQIMKYTFGLYHKNKIVTVYDSTADMTKEQLGDFIDKIVMLASEKLGMVILSPEEYFSNSNKNSK
jgi:glutamate-1-semialdehyde aminotransferase